MKMNERMSSFLLVTLFVMSSMSVLVTFAPEVDAANNTTSGVITGTETWQGSHSLTGDVEGRTVLGDYGMEQYYLLSSAPITENLAYRLSLIHI